MADEAANLAGDERAGKDESSLGMLRDGLGLRCPQCGYILVGVEESGLKTCPECGAGLDFELLRTGRFPLDLNGYSLWQVIWRFFFFSRGFLDLVVTPRYVELRVPDRNPFLLWVAVSMLVFAGLLSLVATLLGGMIASGVVPVVGVILFAAVDVAVRPWLRWLLAMGGHFDPAAGARRIDYVISSQYVPMAMNVALASICMLLMSFGLPDMRLPGFWHVVAVLLFVTGLVYFILWGSWARVVGEMFRVETQWRPTPARYWLILNPGLPLAFVMPFLLFILLIVLS